VHFCQDELYATLATFPVIGYYYKKVHSWYHNKTQHKCHQQGCSSTHSEHPKLAVDTLKVCCNKEFITPLPEGSQIITMREVDDRYGQLPTILLMFDRPLLKIKDFASEKDFTWLVSRHDTLLARFQNRLFVWDGERWIAELVYELTEEKAVKENISLDRAAQIILMFMTNEQIYNSMLDWDKSEAFIKAEKLLEDISQK
jgi:hypothetical protein